MAFLPGISLFQYGHFCIYDRFDGVEPISSTQQKNPGNLAVPGHLTLQYDVHEVHTKIYNYYLSISDYSMIVATRPDPTVRPPSRL